MAGHYGQQLVTYGQANSSYGSWGVSDDPPGGGRGPRRLTREQILRIREDEDALIFAALT